MKKWRFRVTHNSPSWSKDATMIIENLLIYWKASLGWLESPSPWTSMEDSSVVSKGTFSSLTITSPNERTCFQEPRTTLSLEIKIRKKDGGSRERWRWCREWCVLWSEEGKDIIGFLELQFWQGCRGDAILHVNIVVSASKFKASWEQQQGASSLSLL